MNKFRCLILTLPQGEPLDFYLTVIHLPPTHWTMSYPFLEVGVFCREMINSLAPNKNSDCQSRCFIKKRIAIKRVTSSKKPADRPITIANKKRMSHSLNHTSSFYISVLICFILSIFLSSSIYRFY